MDTDISTPSGTAAKEYQEQEQRQRQEMSSASTLDTDLEGQGSAQGSEKVKQIDADSGDGGEVVKPPSKDFPDLAPSKSMEFPDGMLFPLVLS